MNTAPQTPISGFKGFQSGLVLAGADSHFDQYQANTSYPFFGKHETMPLTESQLFCPHPLAVLRYYPPTCSRYMLVASACGATVIKGKGNRGGKILASILLRMQQMIIVWRMQRTTTALRWYRATDQKQALWEKIASLAQPVRIRKSVQ